MSFLVNGDKTLGIPSDARKVYCTDGITVAEKVKNGVYKSNRKTPVQPVPRNADILGGKYKAEDIDEINGNLVNHLTLDLSGISVWNEVLKTNNISFLQIVPNVYLVTGTWKINLGNKIDANLTIINNLPFVCNQEIDFPISRRQSNAPKLSGYVNGRSITLVREDTTSNQDFWYDLNFVIVVK